MPIYEYRCKACGEITEAFLRTRQEAADVRCEHCGDSELERVYLSPVAGVRVSENRETGPCCGGQGGCSSPKRCCENW
jgi:putative FmdB family regulatory protein